MTTPQMWDAPSDLFLLSPTALAYVPSFLLQLVFVGYLLSVPRKSTSIWLLTGWLGLLMTVIFSQILVYSLYSPLSTYINWLGGILPGLGAALLFIQFAYRYPRVLFVREARWAWIVGGGVLAGMAGLMLYEIMALPGVVFYSFDMFTYDMVSQQSHPFLNSPSLFNFLHPLGYVWALLVWLRVAFRLSAPTGEEKQMGGARLWSMAQSFWRPPNRDMETVRSFVLFMLIAPSLTVILQLETRFKWVPIGAFAASFLIGLFIFGLIYINSSPKPTSVMVKVVGISLVTLLSLMGILNRFVMDLRENAHVAQQQSEVALIQALIATGESLLAPDRVVYVLRHPTADALFSPQYELITGREGFRLQPLLDEAARLRDGLAQGSIVAQQAAFHQLRGQLPSAVADQLASSSGGVSRLFRGVFLDPSDHYECYLFSVGDTLYEVGYCAVARRLQRRRRHP